MRKAVTLTIVVPCLAVLFLLLTGFSDGNQNANNASIGNNTSVGEAQPSSRTILPGVIIVKMQSSGVEMGSFPSLEIKMDRYQVETVDAAFPFLATSQKNRSDEMQKIRFVYYGADVNPKAVAADFAADPNVQYAEPWYVYSLTDIPNDTQYGVMTQFAQVSAPTAWDIIKGDSGDVVIAVVDGGTDWDHVDLIDNIWDNVDEIPGNGIDDDANGFIDDVRGWNFANNSNDPTGLPGTPQSASHGTHVSGTAAATTNNAVGVASISWNCILMGLNAASATSDRSIQFGYLAITYAVENGASVINCSWGGLGNPSAFEQEVIDFAGANDVLVVAAAGNDGTNNDNNHHYPSNYNGVLAVGATNKTNDIKAGFSNYGVTTDVFAPGVSILSTTPGNTYSSAFSGTSMASPLVAGLAGLVRTLHPTWTYNQVREQIRVSCDNIDGANAGIAGLLGKGRVNATQALTDLGLPAIRITNVSFTETGGDGIIDPGETVDVTVSFTNYLDNASNVTIDLVENDANVTLTNGTGNIVTLNTNDVANVSFQFDVGSGASDGHVMRFLTDISTSGYDDRDYFELVVKPPQSIEHSTGPVEVSITQEGNIGYIGLGGGGGIGYKINTNNMLFEGGLMVGTGTSTVSDCIRGADGSTQPLDFIPASGSVLSIVTPGQFANEEGTATIVDSGATSPLGIRVEQERYAFNVTPYDEFVIFSYTIQNLGGTALNNVSAGLFFDWDINASANDYARFDLARSTGYVTNASSSPTRIAGTRLLTGDGTLSYRSIHNPNEIYDGFTDTEKWNWMSGGIQTESIDNVDVSTILCASGLTIPAGGNITVAFAVIGAESQSDFDANADAAQTLWNNGLVTGIEDVSSVHPKSYNLYQNYPNPFNPSTQITYDLPITSKVTLTVFNLLGQEIRTLVTGSQGAGRYTVQWDGSNAAGQSVASGVYLYRLEAGNTVVNRKMLFVK